jgi:type II secretory pathway pseudopilin PulG
MREIMIFPRVIQMAKHCSRAVVGILPFGRISVRTLLVVSVIGALGAILVIRSFDTPTSNNLLKDQDRAIWLARTYANQIVDSDIEELRDKALIGSVAAQELVSSPPPDWRGISRNLDVETKYGPFGRRLMYPVRARFSPPDSRMQLLRLRRQGDFLVLTFAAVEGFAPGQFVRIDGRPLIVSVAIRYFVPVPNDRLGQWLRQLVNVSFLPDFIRKRASGDWYLIGYRYSFNLREYYDWVQQNAQRLYAENANLLQQEESRRSNREKERDDFSLEWANLKKDVQRKLDASYQWAEDECKAQWHELMTKDAVP